MLASRWKVEDIQAHKDNSEKEGMRNRYTAKEKYKVAEREGGRDREREESLLELHKLIDISCTHKLIRSEEHKQFTNTKVHSGKLTA